MGGAEGEREREYIGGREGGRESREQQEDGGKHHVYVYRIKAQKRGTRAETCRDSGQMADSDEHEQGEDPPRPVEEMGPRDCIHVGSAQATKETFTKLKNKSQSKKTFRTAKRRKRR